MAVDAELVKEIIGEWNFVSILRKHGIETIPEVFNEQLRQMKIEPCPECHRYCKNGKCNCERVWRDEDKI